MMKHKFIFNELCSCCSKNQKLIIDQFVSIKEEDPFIVFRKNLRQILSDFGVPSNPGWTEEDIENAFKNLLKNKFNTR